MKKSTDCSLTKAEKAALVAEKKWRQAKADCQLFVREYVHIEDRDAPGLAIPFAPWPRQAEVLRAFLAERLVIVLKARQLGLTWLALAYAVWRMLFQPGYSVVALSRKEDDAKELVRRVVFILRHLPRWMTRHAGQDAAGFAGAVWDETTVSVTVEHPGAEPSTFKALPAAPDSGRSFTASLVILDEWAFQPWAEEIWSAAYPTINRPTGGQVIGLSTGKRGTLFETVWNAAMAALNGFGAIFLPWHADPRRTAAWYEQTKKDLPNTYRSEYPATPEEAFTVGQGAFFPEWREEAHVIRDPAWYPAEHALIYGAYDAGFGSRACFKWYAVMPDGSAVCYREYYPQGVIDSVQAETVKHMSVRPDGQPETIVGIVADPSCWNKQSGTGQSTAEVFAQHGLYLAKADNDLANGWRRLHEWLYVGEDKGPRLRFTWACANTIRTYPACEQKKTNPEDISDDCEHHPQDCDRYFVMSRPRPRDPEPTPEPDDWAHRAARDIERLASKRNIKFDRELGEEW